MSLLTSEPISGLAVALLRRSLVLVGTVARVPGGEFSGPSGGQVTIRVPQPRTALEQSTPGDEISFVDIDEVPVTVELRHYYDATRVTDEDLTLSLESFGRQVLRPQVASVAQRAEDQLASVMNGLAAHAELEWAASPDVDADRETVLAIRETLTTNEVPAGDRHVAVAPDITTRLLRIPEFVRADQRGDNGSALEAATVGQVYGLTFVESAAIDAGTSVAYHTSAFGWGNRPPSLPRDVDATQAEDGGVTLRHVLAFDATRLATASVVSVFAGAAAVPDDDQGTIRRAVRVTTAAS